MYTIHLPSSVGICSPLWCAGGAANGELDCGTRFVSLRAGVHFAMLAAALWASWDQSMGGPRTEVESGVTTVSASGGGASGVAGTFLRRSGRVGGGGMVRVGFCGKINSSIGGAAAVVRIRVFAAITKPVSTATCSAKTASNAIIRGRSHRCRASMDRADLVVGVKGMTRK